MAGETTRLLSETLSEVKGSRQEFQSIKSDLEAVGSEVGRIHVALAGDIEGKVGLLQRVAALEASQKTSKSELDAAKAEVSAELAELRAEREKDKAEAKDGGRHKLATVFQIIGALTSVAAIIIALSK